MANTHALKKLVEPHVREWLSLQFRRSFSERELVLTRAPGKGKHKFDAVADDLSIVAAIKCSSGRTSGDNNPSGKCKGAYTDLYFLSLVEAEKKLLVLTDESFFRIFTKDSAGRIADGIDVVYCSLPDRLQILVETIRKTATEEIDRGKARNQIH